jgi:hypothetical protein
LVYTFPGMVSGKVYQTPMNNTLNILCTCKRVVIAVRLYVNVYYTLHIGIHTTGFFVICFNVLHAYPRKGVYAVRFFGKGVT